ncbi:MAG: DNA repair protein RecN [Spirochaetales bacterium]|nr:DNA repair protein RecN [Spirochaetales bacterium]
MLEELIIRNYALIDELKLSFSRGLNILSGETGAGKSILIGALSLLLGEKGDASVVRSGSETAEIAGTLRVDGNPETLTWLREHEMEDDEGIIILRRTINNSGRGGVYIQSTPVTRKDLQDLTALLFDIHGQHEHQSILSTSQQRCLLDRFGGLEEQVKSLSADFQVLTAKKKESAAMEKAAMERSREADLLEFALKEIDQAALAPEEEEDLQREKKLLAQHEKLAKLLDTFRDETAENRGGALRQLRTARDVLAELGKIDDSLLPFFERLETAFYEIEDISEAVRVYQEGINFSPDRLEECESRLAEIHRLEKKYGSTIKDVLSYRHEAAENLEKLSHWEEDRESIRKEIQELEKRVLSSAGELSVRRKTAAAELESRIRGELTALGMPKADFVIQLDQRLSPSGKPVCGVYGFDQVEFLISPNEGEPVKPLKDIASGGELSRVMLAVKTILAETDHINSLIFDEIDAGIGGEVAVAVGEHLAKLGGYKQVLCITHLASIAVRADNHMQVRKETREGRTLTRVETLTGKKRTGEIARMLAGDSSGDASLEYAEELLRQYGKNEPAGL